MSQAGPYLEIINWDKECQKDFLLNKGIPIREKPFKRVREKASNNTLDRDSSKTQQRNMYGIQSPKFATTYKDENGFADRYSCGCKELQGRIYEGEICPICGEKVEFVDVDLEMTGWFILGKKLGRNFIIQPAMFKILKTIIGEKELRAIIENGREINRDGEIILKESKNPYFGIGLIEFKDRFDEIMEYYYKKKKTENDVIKFIKRNKDKVFTSSIPIFSAVLRPYEFKGDSYFFSSVDKKYPSIFYLNGLLKNSEKLMERNKKALKNKKEQLGLIDILLKIQIKVLEIYDLIFAMINQKEGQIKGALLGGRVNFSARNVIIPDPYLKADQISLSYTTVLELYKYETISLITHMKNISENDAFNIWYMATIEYSQEIFELIKFYINKYKPKVIINRNPTINYGSMMTMTVNLKPYEPDDYNMNIPIAILTALNADFDGDILNIISLKTKELQKIYDKAFNPTKNMFISRDDGLFNSDFGLIKNQIIGLYQFNNI